MNILIVDACLCTIMFLAAFSSNENAANFITGAMIYFENQVPRFYIFSSN